MPKRTDIHKILVIGSGPIVIGQAAEFDYAGTQACLALKEDGYEVILVNNNPATMMTDDQFADQVYFEPLTVESLTAIIQKERPDGILGTLGGQTGLNITMELYKKGILKTHDVEILGTHATSIIQGEDRDAFRQLMGSLNEPVPESEIVTTVDKAVEFANRVGYPVIVRTAYTLGGAGGGIAINEEELQTIVQKGIELSPISQCIIEKSIAGLIEIEFEMIRDQNDTCIAVCSMENFDPVGVHTGDSIVIAPQQTLTDKAYEILYTAAVRIIRALQIIGGCNIQFAFNPANNEYYVIEVNPRVSRSSALASKATGYPIAQISTKLSVGYLLHELKNPITGTTFASFEPVLDYVVVKFPRWPFDKFTHAEKTLSTQMKATGEVMAIDRTLGGAFQKAIRSLELDTNGLALAKFADYSNETLLQSIKTADDTRFFAITEMIRRGISVEEIHQLTKISLYFLNSIETLITFEKKAKETSLPTISKEQFQQLKDQQFSDQWLANLWNVDVKDVREARRKFKITPNYYMVDTCAGEYVAQTPYFYSSWRGSGDLHATSNQKKIVVIGSGPIRIGQGIEFDYCSVHGILALKKAGYETVLINNNPETVSTDFQIADRLYFEPLTLEDVLNVIDLEKPEAVIIQYGGQTAINLAKGLEEHGISLLGTNQQTIDLFEDRERFYDFLTTLYIPHIPGKTAYHQKDLQEKLTQVGYPALLRPSYVIGGQGMFVVENEKDVNASLDNIEYPVLIDAYFPGKEVEIDAISDGENVIIPAIFEHIEKAGVHSGDSMAITPPVTISESMKKRIKLYTKKIAQAIQFKGIFNIQFVIYQNILYVLEVNPRASRTVPIVSKITGINMIEESTNALLGHPITLKKLNESSFYTMKCPVFSTNKLPGVDPYLSPEMKSTGEIVAIGETVHSVVHKAIQWNETNKKEFQKPVNIFVDDCPNFEHAIELIENSKVNIMAENHKETAFTHWLNNNEAATIYFNSDLSDLAKQRRIAALKRQLHVISDIDTLRVLLLGIEPQPAELLSLQEWLGKNNQMEMIK